MSSTILNNSQKINKQQPLSFSHLINPQKTTIHKPSQSSENQKDNLSPQQYSKLQFLLQSREASLREHAKHQYQLKLYIQELEQKNKSLQRNNVQILAQYKAQSSTIRKENEALKKLLKTLRAQNLQIKNQLNSTLQIINNSHQQNPISSNIHTNLPYCQQNKPRSQSVIKVIESIDKNSLRESQPNFRLTPYKITGKDSPFLSSYNLHGNLHSQSRQKLEVTIKSSRQIQKPKSSIGRRNQKDNELNEQESAGGDRSLKKLMELRKMDEEREADLMNKKLLVERGNKLGELKRKQKNQGVSNSQQYSNSKQIMQQIGAQGALIQSLSRQLREQFRKSHDNDNSGQFLPEPREIRSRQGKKSHNQLIKLGHYGHPSLHTERTKRQLKKQ